MITRYLLQEDVQLQASHLIHGSRAHLRPKQHQVGPIICGLFECQARRVYNFPPKFSPMYYVHIWWKLLSKKVSEVCCIFLHQNCHCAESWKAITLQLFCLLTCKVEQQDPFAGLSCKNGMIYCCGWLTQINWAKPDGFSSRCKFLLYCCI